jgi:uncharacterized YccA/Bax inhibitor family protein
MKGLCLFGGLHAGVMLVGALGGVATLLLAAFCNHQAAHAAAVLLIVICQMHSCFLW